MMVNSGVFLLGFLFFGVVIRGSEGLLEKGNILVSFFWLKCLGLGIVGWKNL